MILGYSNGHPFFNDDSHTLVIGQQLTTSFKRWILDDIENNTPITVIDIDGLLPDILDSIPKDRIKDIMFLDFADTEYPVAFNPLSNVSKEDIPYVTERIVDSFYSIYSHSWGPQLEEYLRYAIASLLIKDSSLLRVKYLFSKEDVLENVLKGLKDKVIKDFWYSDYRTLPIKDRIDKSMSLRNKMSSLLIDPRIRNILGQKMSYSLSYKPIVLIHIPRSLFGSRKAQLLAQLVLGNISPIPHRVYLYNSQYFTGHTFLELLESKHQLILSATYLQELGEFNEHIFAKCSSLLIGRTTRKDNDALSPYSLSNTPLFRTKQGVFHANTLEDFDMLSAPIFEPLVLDSEQLLRKRCREQFASPRKDVEYSVINFI